MSGIRLPPIDRFPPGLSHPPYTVCTQRSMDQEEEWDGFDAMDFLDNHNAIRYTIDSRNRMAYFPITIIREGAKPGEEDLRAVQVYTKEPTSMHAVLAGLGDILDNLCRRRRITPSNITVQGEEVGKLWKMSFENRINRDRFLWHWLHTIPDVLRNITWREREVDMAISPWQKKTDHDNDAACRTICRCLRTFWGATFWESKTWEIRNAWDSVAFLAQG